MLYLTDNHTTNQSKVNIWKTFIGILKIGKNG